MIYENYIDSLKYYTQRANFVRCVVLNRDYAENENKFRINMYFQQGPWNLTFVDFYIDIPNDFNEINGLYNWFKEHHFTQDWLTFDLKTHKIDHQIDFILKNEEKTTK